MNPLFDLDDELEAAFGPKKEEPAVPQPKGRLVDQYEEYRKASPLNTLSVKGFKALQEREAVVDSLSSMPEEEKQERRDNDVQQKELSAADKFLAGLTPPTVIPEVVYAEITPDSFDGSEEDKENLNDMFGSEVYKHKTEVAKDQLSEIVNYSSMPLGQREAQEMNGVKDHALGLFKERSAEQNSFHHDMMQVAEYYHAGMQYERQTEIKSINTEEAHALTKLESTPFEAAEDNTTGQPDLFAMEEPIDRPQALAETHERMKEVFNKTPMLDKALAQAELKNAVFPSGTMPEDIVKAFQDQSQATYTDTGKQSIKMTVLGDPMAQKRHRHTQLPGAKFVRVYDPSAADKGDLLSMIQQHAPKVPFDCPLKMEIDLYFSRPKAHYNSKGEVKPNAPSWKASGSDVDNNTKLIFDSLNKVFYRDDTLICVLHVTKRYDLNPRTEIVLTVL